MVNLAQRAGAAARSSKTEAFVDENPWKLLILGVAGACFSLASFWRLRLFLVTGEEFFWFALPISFLFLIILLEAFLVKSAKYLILFTAVISSAPFAIFFKEISAHPSSLFTAAAFLSALFTFLGLWNGVKFLNNSLTIPFFTVARATLPKAITGITLFISIVIYLTYFPWKGFNEAVGKKFVGSVLASAEPVVRILIPGVSRLEPVDYFLERIARVQLAKSEPTFQTTSLMVQRMIVGRVRDELKTGLEERTGPLEKGTTVEDALYQMGGKYFKEKNISGNNTFAAIVTIIIFLAIRSIATLFSFLVYLVGYIFLQFFFVIGFVAVSFENRSKEVIILK